MKRTVTSPFTSPGQARSIGLRALAVMALMAIGLAGPTAGPVHGKTAVDVRSVSTRAAPNAVIAWNENVRRGIDRRLFHRRGRAGRGADVCLGTPRHPRRAEWHPPSLASLRSQPARATVDVPRRGRGGGGTWRAGSHPGVVLPSSSRLTAWRQASPVWRRTTQMRSTPSPTAERRHVGSQWANVPRRRSWLCGPTMVSTRPSSTPTSRRAPNPASTATHRDSHLLPRRTWARTWCRSRCAVVRSSGLALRSR